MALIVITRVPLRETERSDREERTGIREAETGRNDRATAEDYPQPQGVLSSQHRDFGPGILMSDLRPPKLQEN